MSETLLAVYAHPDDEAFGTGGTDAALPPKALTPIWCGHPRRSRRDFRTHLATPETLGQVREGELRCAAETMGVTELIFLDYRDSGMVGTREPDPTAYINAPEEQVIPQLVTIIRRLRPQVMATFEPNGGYGHPITSPSTITPWQLFMPPPMHNSIRNGATLAVRPAVLHRHPARSFSPRCAAVGRTGRSTSDFDRFEEPVVGPTTGFTSVDVASTVDSKWEALNCHRTQFGPGNLFRRLPGAGKALMSPEYFALAWPEPEPGLRLPDLFTGLM